MDQQKVPVWAWIVGVLVVLAVIGSLMPDESSETDSQPSPYTQELTKYLLDNFGGAGVHPEYATSWYKYIKGVEVQGKEGSLSVTADTDLWDDIDAVQPAQSICGTLLAWRQDVRSVSVYGRNAGGRKLLVYKVR